MIICGLSKRENTDSLHRKLNLLFLKERRNLHLMLIAFNLSFKSKFTMDPNNRNPKAITTRLQDPNRRHLSNFTPNTTHVENSFSFQIRKKWNSLPTAAHCYTSKETKQLSIGQSRTVIVIE